jgi:hypothetical protein
MDETKPKPDDEREERIAMEIIVDAYGSEEQAIGGIATWKRSFGFY